MKKSTLTIGATLVISLCANFYLLVLVLNWQDAWMEQVLTTATIERLYRRSGADVSYDEISRLVESEYGHFELVPVEDEHILWIDGDKNALLIDGTKLYFKNQQYIGSKANVPTHMKHWGFGLE